MGITFTHVNGATGKKWMPETMGGGVAVVDYNSDGRPDLLFVSGAYWPGDSRAATLKSSLAALGLLSQASWANSALNASITRLAAR